MSLRDNASADSRVPLTGLVSNRFIAEMEQLAALAPLVPVTLLTPFTRHTNPIQK